MNDLEHDLRQLFERRAGDMGASTEAPTQVLRRGRRHQVATAVGGAIAAIGAIAVVVGVGAALLRNPTSQIPSTQIGSAPYGERTATIQGVTVTAPAGWTLIDDWPWAEVIPSGSQTCTFSATGAPVNPSGEQAGSSGTEQSGPCPGTVEAQSPPAGLPILQLANFEMPLGQTVCGLMEQPPATVPAEGVAVYVAQGTDGSMLITQSHDDLVASCPGASAITTSFDVVRGPGPAAGVLVAGPNASAHDLSIAQAVMDRFSTAAVMLSPPVIHAPGYVVAGGNDAGTSWRIEATAAFGQTPIEAVAIVQDSSGNDHAYDVPQSVDGQLVAASGRDLADGTTLSWGTADADVSTLGVVTVEVNPQSWPATLVPWPTGLAHPTDGTTPSGSIWWAIHPPVKGAIRVTLNDGTPQLLSGNDTAPTAAAEVPPTDFPGNLLSYGLDSETVYVFGETSAGEPELLLGIGLDERSNPGTYGWNGPGAWPTHPITYAIAGANGAAVFGTVPHGVAEVRVTTGAGQVLTTRTFHDLRPEFGDAVGWFVIVPNYAAGSGAVDATVQYLDANGSEVYPASPHI